MMMSSTWAAPQQRKRGREEEYADISPGGTLGFTEHRSKRIQAFPHSRSQTSPRFPAQAPSFPPLTQQPRTFAEESSEHTLAEHCGWADEPELTSHNASSGMMVDCDMDMMDTEEPTAPVQPVVNNQQFLGPASFQKEPTGTSVSGRIPTPIHCTFASQIRGHNGNNWNETRHMALATTPEEPSDMAFSHNGMVNEQHVVQNAQAMVDWNMVQQHAQQRRLPSPIPSENGGEDMSGMEINNFGQVTHQHPLIAGIPHREATPGAESPNGNAGGMEVEPYGTGTPSPKRGHSRSRHTLNSWTNPQPGMKRSFSIGYRADCEKCQRKVPGHFNHIIIS
ncbi:hypothetical protein QBC38DRAFT_252885 [Podospora fimiseda]|uniref:Uncharacterized protein n=1 Tax=Podospora fimiseda TaxID=252190 RepID=A0AAN7H1G6_9PEZI|nr:hypothetical protein QBC38DRAFT_252885 [Podospora fimiseda]